MEPDWYRLSFEGLCECRPSVWPSGHAETAKGRPLRSTESGYRAQAMRR